MRSIAILCLGGALLLGCAATGLFGCAATDTVENPDAPADVVGTGGGLSTQRHVVQKGDTLYSIAKRYYGRGSAFTIILGANPGVDPQRLLVGQSLVIPDSSDSMVPQAPSPTSHRTESRVAGWSGTSGTSGRSATSHSTGGAGLVRLRGSTEIHKSSCPKVLRAHPAGIIPGGSGGGPRCPLCH